MTIKKKERAGLKTAAGRKTGRMLEVPQPKKHPEHSAAYDAALTEYAAALDVMRKGNYAAALTLFKKVEKACAEEPETAERARLYATLCARKIAPAAAEPTTAEGRYLLGIVRSNEGRGEDAVRLFDEALRQEPGSSRVLYARAAAWALRGNSAACVTDLRQAIAAEPRLRFQAANDSDFEKIRDESAFVDVIEPTPAGS